jgi:hypothetical protein
MPILVILAMLASVFGMAIPVVALDGDVEAGPGELIIPDPLYDVGMPGTPPGITGWDMTDLRLAYDESTDTMYVGINVETILGDADGDGDPGVTSTYLSDMGGTDHPDLGSSETAAVYFDLNQDGTYDVIAGIGGTTDYYGFSVNVFTGFFYPPYNFGAALPGNIGDISPNPDALHPDLEFTITNWSTLPGHDDAPGFCVGAFLGSLEDAGIGEDFLDYCASPCIEIEKTVDCNDDGIFLDEDTGIAGDTGHWRIVVTNCGDCDLFDVEVWDDNGMSYGPFDLPIGDSQQFDYDTIVEVDTTNWAYVEGYDTVGFMVSDEDDATNLVLVPDICIEKTVDCNDDGVFLDEDTGIAGDTGHWRIVVTNCGEADLFDVYVWDDNGMSWGPFDLPVGDSQQFDYDTIVDVDTTNWAYVDAYDAAGGDWYDEDYATNLVLVPDICIEKTVDCNDDGVFLDEDYGIAGDTGHWRIVVTNCGEADLFDVVVWDDNGMSWGPFDLPVGDSQQFDYDTIVDVDTTNVAYVEGYDAAGGAWYDEDGATNLVLVPDICIEKTVDCNDDGIFLDEDYGTPGDTGHWRIVVTNCGEADLFDVVVWDTNGMSWGPFDLDAGDFVQYDYDTIVNETTTNIAYVEGYDVAGGVWYDEDDATNVVTGNEGCTPGFWKNHPDLWHTYSPEDLVGDVFIIPAELSALADDTLMEALNYDGGKGAIGAARNLLRHAVAALLNAADPDVNYAMSEAAIIADVNAALATLDKGTIEMLKNDLDYYNNAGCSIDAHGNPIILDD